jgi:hypothetical protein
MLNQEKELMTKSVALSAFLLFTAMAQSLQAQTFKVGDYVDGQIGAWIPCTVTQPLKNNGYGISCGATNYIVSPEHIRARAATAAEQKVNAETAAALAHLPRPSNSLGAKYGTREPATCPGRTAPLKGAPSADQATQYFICDAEHELSSHLFLVTNVKVQVAPASHPASRSILGGDLDPTQPIWDIHGSFMQYQCSQAATWDNAFARTHNCSTNDMPTATGYCYKSTSGEWHCTMSDMAHLTANTQQNQMPPAGY